MKIYQITREAVGDFAADPKSQAKMFLQYHTGMMDPATLPKVMAITPNLQLAVQPPPPGSTGSHEETLAYLSAANKKLPPELQVGWDELKQIGGVSDTIELTGEPHPDKYNPATDPTDPDPVATPLPVSEDPKFGDAEHLVQRLDPQGRPIDKDGKPIVYKTEHPVSRVDAQGRPVDKDGKLLPPARFQHLKAPAIQGQQADPGVQVTRESDDALLAKMRMIAGLK